MVQDMTSILGSCSWSFPWNSCHRKKKYAKMNISVRCPQVELRFFWIMLLDRKVRNTVQSVHCHLSVNLISFALLYGEPFQLYAVECDSRVCFLISWYNVGFFLCLLFFFFVWFLLVYFAARNDSFIYSLENCNLKLVWSNSRLLICISRGIMWIFWCVTYTWTWRREEW